MRMYTKIVLFFMCELLPMYEDGYKVYPSVPIKNASVYFVINSEGAFRLMFTFVLV